MVIKKINFWYISSFLISLLVALPIITVFFGFFELTTDYFLLLKNTFLLKYIFNSIILLVGVLFLTFFFGVGAAFDFHAGLIPQAPSWLQSCGMEWFYRLCKEPKRLWRRYLKNNPLFIIRAILQLLNLRNYPLRDADEH